MISSNFGAGFQDWLGTLTFDQACKRHGMLRDQLLRLKKSKGSKAQKKLIAGYLTDSWNECMGMGDPDSAMASALRTVVPLDYLPLLRMRSGVPAAYLIILLCDLMIENLQFALSDDMVLRDISTGAFKRFEVKRKTADKIQEGFGFDRAAAWASMRKLEQDRSGQVSPVMQDIARMAGRMYKAFEYEAIPSKCRDPQEVDGVETGGDIERMLDDEAGAMGIDPEVLARVAEDQANQYQMSGESIHNRGPLVVVLDESGSMHGKRMIWAKSCAIALTRLALAEGRVVHVVHFSTGTDVHEVRPDNADDMLLIAESFMGGGTDIETALDVARMQVANLKRDAKDGADIVFITDGVAGYSEHHFKEMKRDGVQLWTVAIDVDLKEMHRQGQKHRGGFGLSTYLYSYARAYVHIDQATINSDAQDAIAAVVQLRDSALDNTTREEVAGA